MTNRENYLNIARRKGYEKMPVHLEMCPSLQNKFAEYCRKTGFSYTPVHVHVPDLIPVYASDETFLKFYDHNFKSGTFIDEWGVAHEPGSAAAFHMTKMHHPMGNFDSVEQILFSMKDRLLGGWALAGIIARSEASKRAATIKQETNLFIIFSPYNYSIYLFLVDLLYHF